MEAQIFKEKIYGPYGDAWKIIKILQEAEDDAPALTEILYHYMEEVFRYEEKYKDNEFAQLLLRVMHRSDTVIMRMDRNEVQKTETDK